MWAHGGSGTHSRPYLAAKALWLQLPTPIALGPMTLVSLLLVAQGAPAYLGQRDYLLALLLLLAAVLAAATLRSWLLWGALGALAAGAVVVVVVALTHQTIANVGHRCGGHGLGAAAVGPQDNSLEALEQLALMDQQQAGGLQDFFYVEFDVRETADHALVCLHDRPLSVSFPGPANRARLNEMGLHPHAGVERITLDQIKSLDLGGRVGCRVPTMGQLLDACKRLGVRRTVAVEVKSLYSDAGRGAYLSALQEYIRDREGYYRPFGSAPAAAIGFPSAVAGAFGRLGGAAARAAAAAFRGAGVPLHSTIIHRLDLAPDESLTGGWRGLWLLVHTLLNGGGAGAK